MVSNFHAIRRNRPIRTIAAITPIAMAAGTSMIGQSERGGRSIDRSILQRVYRLTFLILDPYNCTVPIQGEESEVKSAAISWIDKLAEFSCEV